ncbi:dihydrofolate reductase family protein [Chitinophaga flava]|uniref:Deaminase n=1 Tax=Chitinophaga flava TaxID=2259036 RepID=A0A365Y1M0_9BACT|nr:dihydrofolate reductase family protein [Chitinophaga flava]RBL92400.1 deaminase [Chitinophaga flava]
MNKLILETQISIDGFIADKNGGTDWMIWNWGPAWNWDEDLQLYHTNLNKSASRIIISSQMAKEGFNAHWHDVASRQNDKQYNFAHHIDNASKYVISTTLTKDVEIPGGWSKTDILNGDLKDSITTLKKSEAGDIIVYGGATLVSNLINEDLIDEYHLIVNPVALGSGLSIFKKSKHLKLIKSTSFSCGVIVNQYSK